MMNSIKTWLKEAGSNGGLWLASIVLAFGLGLSLVVLPELGADTTPTKDDAPKVIVNASGVQGYRVDEAVCNAYLPIAAPELKADNGLLYTLSRTTNGVSESLMINADQNGNITNPDFNRHFFDTSSGQKPENAYVTDDGWKCIKEKAGKK